MKYLSLLLALLVIGLTTSAQAETYTDVAFDATQRYSQLIIDSRLGDFYGNTTRMGFDRFDAEGHKTGSAAGTMKFDYVSGLVAKATIEAVEYYADSTFARPWFYAIQHYANTFAGSVPTSGSSLDNLNASKIYTTLYDLTQAGGKLASLANGDTPDNAQKAMKRAIQGLTDTNKNYVISQSASADAAGGWWHKKNYPNQMWLDGQYMGPALLAQLRNYGYGIGDETTDWKTITRQFDITWSRLWISQDALLRHAFSATPTDSYASCWADPVTGISQEYWGRACGWYFLALVDVLALMPEGITYAATQSTLKDYPADCRQRLTRYLTLLAEGLAARQGAASGCWYQLLAHDGTFAADSYQGKTYQSKRNYLESSCSAIFAATYLKALRLGLLDETTYGAVAERAYEGVVTQFVKRQQDGTYTLIDCCASAGLGGSNNRDGSAAYYLLGSDVKRVTTYTEGKVLGAFILASVEYERRKDAPNTAIEAIHEHHIAMPSKPAPRLGLPQGFAVHDGRLILIHEK